MPASSHWALVFGVLYIWPVVNKLSLSRPLKVFGFYGSMYFFFSVLLTPVLSLLSLLSWPLDYNVLALWYWHVWSMALPLLQNFELLLSFMLSTVLQYVTFWVIVRGCREYSNTVFMTKDTAFLVQGHQEYVVITYPFYHMAVCLGHHQWHLACINIAFG